MAAYEGHGWGPAKDFGDINQASSLIEDLRKWQKQIDALPPRLNYIVLDHAHPYGASPVHGRDAKGKRYVITSPAILDGVKHYKKDELPTLPTDLVPPGIGGVPVIRRSDLPDEWPGEAA